jgi:hypothetical protein
MLGYHYDDGGFMELYGSLLPEDGAVVQKALEAVAERLHQEQEQDATTKRSYGQRYADALVEMARVSLAHGSETDTATSPPAEEVMGCALRCRTRGTPR